MKNRVSQKDKMKIGPACKQGLGEPQSIIKDPPRNLKYRGQNK